MRDPYLKFNLRDVRPGSVNKAVLRLYHYHTGGGNSVDLGVYRVTNSWLEGRGTYKPATPARANEITWVHQPSFDATLVARFNPGKDTNKLIEVDITRLVKSWLSGTPNYGLVVKSASKLSRSVSQAQYGFLSRETKDASKRPALILIGSKQGGVHSQSSTGHDKDSWDKEDSENDKIVKDQTAYQKYIQAYNKLTALMAAGKGDTPEAQDAYRNFKKAKDEYEASR